MSTINVNPNYDGHLLYYPESTGAVEEWYRVTDRPVIGVTGDLHTPSGKAYRAFLDFDDDDLPVGYTVSAITLHLYTSVSVITEIGNNMNIDGLSTSAQSETDDETLWNNLISGSSYNTNVDFSAFGWNFVALGGTAVSDFNSQGRLTLGLAMVDENGGSESGGTHYVKFFSMENEESPPEDFYPYLEIEYTTGGGGRKKSWVS